jgi:hypothetical protein
MFRILTYCQERSSIASGFQADQAEASLSSSKALFSKDQFTRGSNALKVGSIFL